MNGKPLGKASSQKRRNKSATHRFAYDMMITCPFFKEQISTGSARSVRNGDETSRLLTRVYSIYRRIHRYHLALVHIPLLQLRSLQVTVILLWISTTSQMW
jgi:hypothetical protein